MKRKIIVCDESSMVLEALSLVLTDEYEVYTISQSKKLIGAVESIHPDILLMSAEMHWQFDGNLILQSLFSKTFKNIPVIMMSANPADSDAARAWGADSFLPKPLDLNELYYQLEKCTKVTCRSTA
ncbi:PleD family two-component system response regulator [Sphingobacterium sp. 2149]|uniref:response regulator n=1 Tax=Sphingobacterium sp. 2149 TaxID=2817763 RepID=UPI001AE81C87|nr:response regulator [Sphingobacterium sp. 2149]MDR6734762.1 DNA-binding response OmpR family regulator [Sphingobacterium sp. 2149]